MSKFVIIILSCLLLACNQKPIDEQKSEQKTYNVVSCIDKQALKTCMNERLWNSSENEPELLTNVSYNICIKTARYYVKLDIPYAYDACKIAQDVQ